jgi:hypothetical protein
MQVNTKFLEADVVSSDADIGEETGTTEMKATARIVPTTNRMRCIFRF